MNVYAYLLPLHSLFRWLVVLGLTYATYRAWKGWKTGRVFETVDHTIGISTVVLVYTQVLLGLWLYTVSPIVKVFMTAYPDSVHQRGLRFFGMEHIVMMLTAVTVLSIGYSKAKRQLSDRAKFKTLFRWFLSALLIIFVSIPWQFSPFTSRPYWRWF